MIRLQKPLPLGLRAGWLCVLALVLLCRTAAAEEAPRPLDFRQQIEPILVEHCYQCHALGEKKGQIAFDEITDEQLLANRDLWWRVLRNVRSKIMPPEGHPRPSDRDQRLLAQWIKYQGLAIDPQNPDPGRVTLRRLNRVEYRNTIRDLMGHDFKANEEFPVDDTGYGFDNIGDVLTVSPLLVEKYLSAAEAIVAAAVPTMPKSVQEKTLAGNRFKDAEGKIRGDSLSFYEAAEVTRKFSAPHAGRYRLYVEVQVKGRFSFDPGRCRMTFSVDEQPRLNKEYGWEASKKYPYEFELDLTAGDHQLIFQIEPLTPPEKKINSLELQVLSVVAKGPLDEQHWVPTTNYARFFPRDIPPMDAAERRDYARDVLGRFARQAFRRPVDKATIERLVDIAEGFYRHQGKRFEEGIQRALVAALASPYFLFRVEGSEPGQDGGTNPMIDEFALATRVSYFLWSSMPDEELMRLAERGELRKNLPAQVQRMLKDSRSHALLENFIGQWLQVRDIEGVAIDEQAVVARDDLSLKKLAAAVDAAKDDAEREALEKRLEERQKKIKLDAPLRKAMQQEAELLLGHIVQGDRNVLELVDSNYTFANQVLAAHYGLPELDGEEMQRVELPADSPRGGVLTMGAVLIATSNPDRTSPVKRGLFILDNLLGAPPPPPPANVPALEVAEKEARRAEPTMRETLEIHRSKPLCNSCHARMDPLGLGLENFNALGRWRDRERGEPIDARGQLSTGEKFASVRDLKEILVTRYREDFYRCLTEKLFTYALGRGLTYDDVHQVDAVVERLEKGEGRFSILLAGIIDSPQFQKRRGTASAPTSSAGQKTISEAPQ